MKQRMILFGLLASMLLAPLAVDAQRRTSVSKPVWTAKIIAATTPGTVATYGGKGSRGKPAQGKQWVSLTVEVRPPSGENLEIKQYPFHVKVTPGDVVFESVQMSDGSKNIYPAVAIDCPKKNNTDRTYLFFEALHDKRSIYLPRVMDYAWHEFTDEDRGNRVAGFVFANVGADWVVYVWDIGILRFQPKRASTAHLLFEVPTSARQLAFKIGNSKPIPIQGLGAAK